MKKAIKKRQLVDFIQVVGAISSLISAVVAVVQLIRGN